MLTTGHRIKEEGISAQRAVPCVLLTVVLCLQSHMPMSCLLRPLLASAHRTLPWSLKSVLCRSLSAYEGQMVDGMDRGVVLFYLACPGSHFLTLLPLAFPPLSRFSCPLFSVLFADL